MSPQRARMIDDMILAGLAEGTRKLYVQAVRRLAAHYRRPPDLLSGSFRCRSRYSTNSATYGGPIATAAGYSPTAPAMRHSITVCCHAPSPRPPAPPTSSPG
jgi:hypothetical protein